MLVRISSSYVFSWNDCIKNWDLLFRGHDPSTIMHDLQKPEDCLQPMRHLGALRKVELNLVINSLFHVFCALHDCAVQCAF